MEFIRIICLIITFLRAGIGWNGSLLLVLDLFLWKAKKTTDYKNKYSILNTLKEAVRAFEDIEANTKQIVCENMNPLQQDRMRIYMSMSIDHIFSNIGILKDNFWKQWLFFQRETFW